MTHYRKAKLEKFAAYLRSDGLVTLLTTYKDLDCECLTLAPNKGTFLAFSFFHNFVCVNPLGPTIDTFFKIAQVRETFDFLKMIFFRYKDVFDHSPYRSEKSLRMCLNLSLV